MPVISVVIPQLKTNQLRWTFTGAFQVYNQQVCLCLIYITLLDIEVNKFLVHLFHFMTMSQARQSLIVRGLFPMLADPRHPVRIIQC